ncbi:MAG: cupin domain-containing protein, partial [Chloroflexota bacterium]|nr:cupin domain-containing protein [Chloroflexota bacterium]
TYTQDQWLGHVPMKRDEIKQRNTIRVIHEPDYMWRLEGKENPTLIGLLCATEHLTVGKVYLQPGQHSDVQVHGGDESLYVVEGTLHMQVHDGQRPSWFELKSGDGFYVPHGVEHQCYNIGDKPVSFVCGIAPNYLPPTNE